MGIFSLGNFYRAGVPLPGRLEPERQAFSQRIQPELAPGRTTNLVSVQEGARRPGSEPRRVSSTLFKQVLPETSGQQGLIQTQGRVVKATALPSEEGFGEAAAALRVSFNETPKLQQTLAEIDEFRRFLDNPGLSSRWIESMRDRAFILEAHHTTHIEGTTLTLKQSEKLLRGEPLTNADQNDARELLNYREAFDLVATYLGSGAPITEVLIREIQSRLVVNVRGNSAGPGRYRSVQNYVSNAKTGEVIYTPPIAAEVPLLMGDLVQWLNQETRIHPVLVAGIAQSKLVDIHPFLDGNGRTARLLSTLCLYRADYDFKQLFSLSEYYDRHRIAYYQAIQSTRKKGGDLTEWLEYFSHGLGTQMREVQTRGEQALQIDRLAQEHGFNERQCLALETLLEFRELTLRSYIAMFPNVPSDTLQRELEDFEVVDIAKSQGPKDQRIYRLITSGPLM